MNHRLNCSLLVLLAACSSDAATSASASPAPSTIPAAEAVLPATPLSQAPPATKAPPEPLTPATLSWDAALTVLRGVGSGDRSTVVSPLSIGSALDLARRASRGETRAALERVLAPAADVERHGVSAAVRMFVDDDLAVLEPLAHELGPALASLDYAKPEPARVHINGWIANQTRGKIPELIPQGAIGPATSCALVSALYFRGHWAEPFDPARTTPGTFYAASGEALTVPMMVRPASYQVARAGDAVAVELPYQGGHLTAAIVLPTARDGLAALERSLTGARLHRLLASVKTENVSLMLPKFSVDSGRLELGATLDALGLSVLRTQPDFSALTARHDIQVGSLVHAALLEVDERGAEGAAATAIAVRKMRGSKAPPRIAIDHPFLFLIRDVESDALVFLARVNTPTP